MENTLKIKVFIKSILFCKYLRNGSSDLYENLCGGQLLSCEFKFYKDPCINAHVRVVNARAHVLSRVRAFTTHARAFVHRSS